MDATEQIITDALMKHCIAMEDMTVEQLARVVKQAIDCGDIARYSAMRNYPSGMGASIEECSQVVYIPYAGYRKVEAHRNRLAALLRYVTDRCYGILTERDKEDIEYELKGTHHES